MQNKSMRSRWERLFKRKTSQSTPQAVELPHEASPEIQLLAARITSRLIAHKSEAQLNPEQLAEWQRLKEPLTAMFSKYKMTHLFRRLGTQDEARQVFQSTLLGVLISDSDLLGQFNAALPLPVLDWLPPESEKLTTETAVLPLEYVPPIESEPVEEISGPVPTEITAPVMSAPPIEAETVSEDVIPPAVEPEPSAQALPVEEGESTELELLVRELGSNPEFYRVVAALRNNNPGLYKLASLLVDYPDLSIELSDFFSNSKLGTQLLNQQIREER